jgi:RHS repeat-associated protein
VESLEERRVLTAPTVIEAVFVPRQTFNESGAVLALTFSERIVGLDNPANYEMWEAGVDQVFNTADDVLVFIAGFALDGAQGDELICYFNEFQPGRYRFTLQDAVTDIDLNLLDGDGNGSAGGDWIGDYVVNPHYPLTLNQSTIGKIENSTYGEEWSFLAAANTGATIQLLNANVPGGLNFHLVGDFGFDWNFGTITEPLSITFPATGTYTLRVTSNGPTTGGAYAFRFDQTTATLLQLGVPFQGVVPSSGFSQLFKVEVAQATPLVISYVGDDATDRVSVYAKSGAIPSRTDYLDARWNSASPTMELPLAPPGTLYVLVYADKAIDPSNFTLRIDELPAAVKSVSPNQFLAGNAQATVLITGQRFIPGTQVALVPSGGGVAILPESMSIDQSTQITASFNLASAAIGDYDMRVTIAPGVITTQPAAVKIVAAGQGKLKTELILPGALGRYAPATIYVEYFNDGTAPIESPILVLKSADTNNSDRPLLTLNQKTVPKVQLSPPPVNGYSSANGYLNSVQIYASGASPGLILPGERIRVPVYYAGLEKPYDLTDTAIELAIGVHSVGDPTPLDWSTNGDFLRPDWIASDVWPLVHSNLQLQIGGTWGDYVRTLRNNAQYLNRFGQSFVDVSELYGFELRKALGLDVLGSIASARDAQIATPAPSLSFGRSYGNTLSSRHQSGVFGRGWDASWQYRFEQLSDGTLIVHESADRQRRYQPDLRNSGKYLGQEGDTGIMQAVSGGFELTEYSSNDGFTLLGYSFKTRYRSDGKLDFVQDKNNNRITPSYTGSQITSLTHSAGGSLSIAYNGAGRISSISDSAGRVTNYFYDPSDTFLLSVSGPTGLTSYTYNPANGSASEYALRTITGPDGLTKHFDYDARGRIIASYSNANVGRTDFDYSENGRVKATDLTGKFTNSFFDASGLLVRIEDAIGNYVVYKYDANRQPVSTNDNVGRVYSQVQNDSGRPKAFTDAFGKTVLSFVNGGPNKAPTSYTDANGNTTRYTYDANGNLLSTQYPDNTVESATYDASGNLDVSTNRRSQTIDRTVNAAGQVTQEVLSSGVTRDYIYDSRGRLHIATDSVSGTTTLDYDTADRLTKITYPNGRWLEYSYDLAGRRTRIADQAGFATNYEYNASGQLIRLRDAVNAMIVEYAYDLAGRLLREDKANGTYTLYGYDAVGRQSSIFHYTPLGVVNSKFLYTFDAAGRRDTQTTIDGVWTYTYDLNDQLVRGVFVSSNPSIPSQDLQYEYDAQGNRTRTVLNGVATAYSPNAMNQYTSAGGATFTYDLDGNLTQENGPGGLKNYFYNQRNQLVRVETPQGVWQYEYDVLGNRSASIFNGVRTEFLVDPIGLGNVVRDYQTIGANTQSVGYAYGLGLEASFRSGNTDYYDFDTIGSTSGMSDASGAYVNRYAYNPWGESLLQSETVANSFEFVGQAGVMNESNGLQFMRARFYSNAQGRFVAQDPLRLNAGDINFYRYVGNEPISRNDPSGLFGGGGCAGVFGFSGGGGEGGGGAGIGGGGFAGLAGIAGLAVGVGTIANDDNNVAAPVDGFNGAAVPGSVAIPQTIPLPNPPVCLPGDLGCTGVGGVANVVSSIDPNEKLGAAGFGPQAFIPDNLVIPYRINFENLGPGSIPPPAIPATAPAQRVEITDQLSANLDWSTFEFSEFGFGDRTEIVPSGRTYFFKSIEIESGSNIYNVEVQLEFNLITGVMRAVFQSIDPTTGLPPDVLTGFLPPEDGFGSGKAHVDFKIKPKANLASGTQLRNIANIRFDYQTDIATNQVDPQNPSAGTDPNKEALNTIDSGTPTSSVIALPATTSTLTFPVTWSGSDDVGGSGLATYDLFVSENGGAFTLLLQATTQTSFLFTGLDEHTYAFYSRATDHVGHEELAPVTADSSTRIVTNSSPTIVRVIATGSAWLDEFIDAIDGGGINGGNGIGYELTPGLTIPNIGFDSLYAQFSEPVIGFDATSVQLLGVDVSDYSMLPSFLTVTYDSVNMRGIISLPSSISRDKLRLGVSDSITDLAMKALDGDSNGLAGGVFDFRFNILVGDANNDGSVNGGDLPVFATSFNKTFGSPLYNPRADWNSSVSVNGGDLPTFSLQFNRSLPTADPGALNFPPPSLTESDPESMYAPIINEEDIDEIFIQLSYEDELLLTEDH